MDLTTGKAWERLFDELHIRKRLEADGRFDLGAAQIKKLTGREPRIMSKWDSRAARPKILGQAGVTILPTSRQGYVLLKGDGYEALPHAQPATVHPVKRLMQITTLPWRKELTTESAAIDVATISFMLQKFTGEEDITLTIRGRSGTPRFSFDFAGRKNRIHRIDVDRAQIEVDAGFEGEKVWLVEAKIGEPEDFLIRQLYYPWRAWAQVTSKPVVPVFLTYSNKTFGLFRYAFERLEDYHSAKCIESRWFTLDEPEKVRTLPSLFDESRPAKRPAGRGGIPFPQADTLGTVITVVELYASEASKPSDISDALGYAERQGGYYSTAPMWLGFVQHGHAPTLTAEGREFVAATKWKRFEILFKAVAATPVFREAIRARIEGAAFNLAEITERILSAKYVAGSTAPRRAKTVQAWLDWLWREYANLAV